MFTKESTVIFGSEFKAKYTTLQALDGSKLISNKKRPLRQEFVTMIGTVAMKQTFRQIKGLNNMDTQPHKNWQFLAKWILQEEFNNT
eukprot:7110403-Heterocapsa_arctica.AAC.1